MLRSNRFITKKNLFAIKITKPRKGISFSPLKLSSEEMANELGPQYRTIDVHIGNQRMVLDMAQGGWILDGTSIEPADMTKLEKQRNELEKDNSILRTKLDILLEMLAETTAEKSLQEKHDK
ncbi:unnamed protein product [Rotaria sp. Silwood1]|nr:unnamed protein product [Rotaria sp. Silwood1]CAF4677468.1 unnamed protein product [Rotaria sp. Silwood1]